MALKINETTNRLTRDELEDIRLNSGITDLQFEIIKRKYFDSDNPTVVAISMSLNISERKYNVELRKALEQIYRYTYKR